MAPVRMGKGAHSGSSIGRVEAQATPEQLGPPDRDAEARQSARCVRPPPVDSFRPSAGAREIAHLVNHVTVTHRRTSRRAIPTPMNAREARRVLRPKHFG